MTVNLRRVKNIGDYIGIITFLYIPVMYDVLKITVLNIFITYTIIDLLY